MKKMLLFALVVGVALHAIGGDPIIVRKTGDEKITLDLAAFKSGEGAQAKLFRQVLEADLKRSGWFAIGSGGGLQVIGTAAESGGGMDVQCVVANPAIGKTVMQERYSESEARKLAHKVADDIVWAVKKKKGIASTRIVLIGNRKGKKDLYLCDADGANLRQITQDGAICLSPAWTPDANSITYTSYVDKNRPYAYVQNLASRSRRAFATFPGMNSGARVAPDGSRVAIILAKDGSVDLYTMELSGRGARRQTASKASEASPAWSADGKTLAFVSDRAGTPQIYVRSGDGSDQRVSFVGSENVNPDWSVDGKLAWCTRRSGRYQICVAETAGGRGKENPITNDGFDYETPSWAPNGRHIVCSRTGGYHSDIYIIDSMAPTETPIRLTSAPGEWYAPAWSPK